jgi:CRISPR-associated endonuclease/helicase Cas3
MRGRPTSFWGKISDDAWHPLDDHCADVGACARALLELDVLRRRLARLGGLDDLSRVQVDRLAALAVLHDVGKFNIGFQNKAWEERFPKEGHVGPIFALLGSRFQGQRDLCRALKIDTLHAWIPEGENGITDLLLASLAHHGRPMDLTGPVDPALWRPAHGLDPIAGAEALRRSVESWLPRAFSSGSEALPASAAFSHAFAGLVMLADWIGSDTRFFPYSETEDGERFATSFERAKHALEEIGVDAGRARSFLAAIDLDFPAIFDLPSLWSHQRVVAKAPADPAGSVAILEAETGSGKTEAAVARFLALFREGLVDGMFFALPTRTAATQIHKRLAAAIARAFPEVPIRPPVVLAVPSYVVVDDHEGKRLPGFEVLWNDSDAERWRFRGWAAEMPKRYMAGAIVVGTIDQALLSALQVSHSHLRATALLRHLLVVDEVHSSDAYMNRILEQVLRRHLEAGGHALLMSATLGSEARRRLSAPLAPRLPERPPLPFERAIATDFPLLTLGSGRELADELRLDASTSERAIHVGRSQISGEPSRIADLVLDGALRGARVLVVRNTVADCIETQRALEDVARRAQRPDLLFGIDDIPAPHHSRYSRDDRSRLDDAIEARLGKTTRRDPVVVVATQTVQQSLDLDADLLLTDLCPMDVLLQRAGRLHRHAGRPRPPGFETPRAIVLTAADRDMGGYIRQKGGRARGPHGIGTVYPDLRVLEATWAFLEAHAFIRIPGDNRLAVESATHPDALERACKALGEFARDHVNFIEGKNAAERGVARLNVASWEKPYCEEQFPRDRSIPTRLGEGDRRVEFSPPPRGPFGSHVKELSIPAHLAAGVPPDALAKDPVSIAGGFEFSFGERRFVYDRLGLRPANRAPEVVPADEDVIVDA